MQTLTRVEFLEILGLTSGAFDQMQHAGYVALAFGAPMPAIPGRYVDLDLVAMAINLGLTPSLGRENSATIVAALFEQWARAVGNAEADPKQNYFLAVGGIGWDPSKRSAKRLLVTHGTTNQIAKDFNHTDELCGFFTVSVSDIIRRLRERAHQVGIDLSRPFFFLPDDPLFEQFFTQFKRERDGRIARVRRDKKKSAIARQRKRYQGISVLPRVA
jgi:hypothetical protein